MQPTLLVDAQPHMRIMQEEIFGPVLSIYEYTDLDDAIRVANGTAYGLCAGVYTKDLDKAHWLATRLTAGQVYVNQWFAGGIETPFGGVRNSGYGREKGQEAVQGYLRTKNVGIRIAEPKTTGA